MEKTKVAGGSFLSNLQNQRVELDGVTTLNLENNIELEENNIEISEKNVEEIDIKNYLDVPIEVLIKNSTEVEIVKDDIVEDEINNEMKFYLEEKKQNIIDIEFIDVFNEDIPFLDNSRYEIEEVHRSEFSNEENEQKLLLKTLQDQIIDIQEKLFEKDKEIIELKEENKDLQQTLMKEQDIIMKEQDLHDKTLSRVEQLLLEKRTELIERQKASKKNWFLKLIDKVKA
ncbi:MAG: hypothetical protein ACRCTZ_03375 [Sarcina sp.]